jgi:hypothetical protein
VSRVPYAPVAPEKAYGIGIRPGIHSVVSPT